MYVSSKLKFLFTVATVVIAYSSTTYAGGANGGGGNALSAKPVSEAQVREAAKNVRVPMIVVAQILKGINQGGLMYTNTKPPAFEDFYIGKLKPFLPKLFPQSNAFEAKIQSAKIDLREKGACIDPVTQKKKDASADPATNTICLSLSRLKDRLLTSNYYNQVLALAMHEVSHLSGLNEDQAELVQNYTSEKMDNSTIPGFEQTISIIIANIRQFAWDANNTVELIDSGAPGAEICAQVGSAWGYGFATTNTSYYSNHISAFNLLGITGNGQQPELDQALNLAVQARTDCSKDPGAVREKMVAVRELSSKLFTGLQKRYSIE